MIKYNNNTINDWNFGDDNIIKVYRNNAIVFYKFDSETQEFKVCYAVVEDITQYSEREFIDVFNKADGKWYKLNNLNQYEEYGVYGSGRNITYYEGKLTFEHVVTPAPSRLPNGYTEVEYIQNTGTSTSNGAYINSGLELYDVVGNSFSISGKVKSEYYAASGYDDLETIINSESVSSPYYGFVYRYAHSNHVIELSCNPSNSVTLSSTANSDGSRDIVINCNSTTVTDQVPLGLFASYNANYTTPYRFAKATIYSMSIVKNGTTVRDFVPAKRDSDDKYGLYDLITDTFYISPNGNNFIGGTAVTPSIITSYEYLYTGDSWVYLGEVSGSSTLDYVVYPMYYDEKSDPLDNLTFTSTTQAEDYAYNNCVYDGMKATIDGDRYVFDSEEGWVYVPEYYKVEDVTPNSASGWTISGSSTYNPDSSYYDDFDLETTATYMSYKIAKVTIYGYDHFTYYLRSYHQYSSSYAYVMASNIDELSTDPTSMGYNSNAAITSTYYFNKTASSDVNLNNYRRVTYNNLDKTVEHTFYVVFYGRTYSSYVGNATILIPKNQTNENWEQVTFSASSNVASSQKNLYIDGNNSTSGGTQYWYYRWMIGLPSGSHTSYTTYSNYNYCPNVTSSTFTSVAGEQRQVNFTYDGTTTKTLSFRLTDGSNVLTPSDTVYYNMTYYNSCGASSSSSNVTFPRSQSVNDGGRFRFANSSNRHYIYGYSPNISLNYDYYVDNYQSTFDITYTKLSDEAVTITYTTYDPNDSEIPAFKTDITWPYSGGTESSTTLTSYDVPYTYPYKVSQTSDKFSVDSQSYTANQAARTISFILYPNNREFSTVADMEAYQYAWEGMKATVGDKNYKYENGEWVEKASKDSDFVIGDFNTFISSSTEVTEGYYIIYYFGQNSSYADKNYLFSWNSGNTWSGYYTLGNMNHRDASASVPISSSEIIDDAVWEFKDAGNGNFYIRNVATNKYWYYLGTSTNYGVPLTDNANDATPVSIQDWRSCLAFVEKQSSSNHPINRLYGYPYRYGWYSVLTADGNNQYYMRKYVP